MPDKCRRGIRTDLIGERAEVHQIFRQFRSQQIDCRAGVTGDFSHAGDCIAEDQGIRDRVDGVDLIAHGIRDHVCDGTEAGGQVSAGRSPARGDPVRDHAPCFGVVADQPHGTDRILLRFGETVGRHPVLKNKGMETKFVEPAGNGFTFGTFADAAVAAARDHQDRRVSAFQKIGCQIRFLAE